VEEQPEAMTQAAIHGDDASGGGWFEKMWGKGLFLQPFTVSE
jgi:hypothetical protein